MNKFDELTSRNTGCQALRGVPAEVRGRLSPPFRIFQENLLNLLTIKISKTILGSVGLDCTFSRKLRFCCENGRMALLGQIVLL